MKAIIFDMDGLMIDTEGLYFDTEREIAKSFGKELKDETLWKMMGRKPIEAISIYVEDLQLGINPQEILKIRDDIFQEKLKREVIPMPGLYEILKSFRGKLKMAIATGSPEKFLKIVMDNLKLQCYFDVMQTSDNITKGKPEPEIYLRTIERMGVIPQECIVLEDSSNGALAGKRAGCHTIAIPTEYTNTQDFSFVDYIAKDLKEAEYYIRTELL
ncbi:MAG: HAD family phosphatase [Clostridiaceae bacterium]|nr:HAD family phosphatase [Clostridiaceae bacterium]